jgi:plasmid stability protein
MSTVLLKGFPDDLHRDLRIIAAKHGCTMKALIIKTLMEMVRKAEGK